MSSSYPSTQGSGNYWEEEVEQSQEAEGIGGVKEAGFSRHSRTDAHMNSETVAASKGLMGELSANDL